MARSVSPVAARVALLGVAVLTLSLMSSTTSAAPGAMHGHAKHSTFSVATYNAEARQSPARTMRSLARILDTEADIVALQEMASGKKRKLVRERFLDCKRCVWDAYMPRPASRGETPLLFRSPHFRLEASGTKQVTKATYVGRAGAGPSTIGAKYVTWVRLRDLRSGRVVHVLNNHTVPSVQGRGGGPNYRLPKRLKLYRKHMAGVQSLVRQMTRRYRWGLVFVVGDLNVNYRRDRVVTPSIFPYRRLGDVGLRASYRALGEPRMGTHKLASGRGTRLIDHVYFRPRRSLDPLRQRIMTGLASDHRPLLVTFKVSYRP